MSKSTKPRNDWEAIRLDYINGMPMKELSAKYDISHNQILNKARQKGWGEHRSLVTDYDNVAVCAAAIIDDAATKNPELKALQAKLHNNLLPSQIEQANKDVAMLALYKANLMTAQQKIVKALDKSADQVNEILETHKDGLYTSRIGADGSVSYEPTNNHLKNLAPFFVDNHKALGLSVTQTAVQVNNNLANTDNNDNSNKVVINIAGKK